VIWKYSDIGITFDNDPDIGEYAPTMGWPSEIGAIVAFGNAKKLNAHWNSVDSYIAKFNSDIASHNLSRDIESFCLKEGFKPSPVLVVEFMLLCEDRQGKSHNLAMLALVGHF
jgi:hypothetical protein